MTSIHSLNGTMFILTGELTVIHCLSIFFSSRYCNYFLEYSQTFILSTVLCIFLMLEFAAIQVGPSTLVQNTSHSETNLLPNQLYHQSSNDYNEMRDFRRDIFSEYQVVWISYFLLGNNTFSNQLLLEDKYFFQYSFCFGRAFSPE